MKSFSQILYEITTGIDPLCTIQEVAGVTRVHEQTVYGWRQDHTEPSFSKVIALSHYLIKEHDYYALAMQFLLSCEGRANGRVEDDLLRLYENGTDLHRAFSDKDKVEYQNALARMKNEIKDLEKEGEMI